MRKQNIKIFYFLLSLILFIQLNAFAQAPEESLYKRLGGVYNIAAVVDDFVDRLLADPIITGNKNIVSAMGKITKPGLKYQITELLCQAAGGPQKYNGRSMKDSHQGLNITEAEWQAMMKDFLATLAKFNIKGLEQNELLVIVGSIKSDIVLSAPPQIPTLPNAQPTNPAPQVLPSPARSDSSETRRGNAIPAVPSIPQLPALPNLNNLNPPQPPALPSIPSPQAPAPSIPNPTTSPQVPVIPALPNPANAPAIAPDYPAKVVPSLPQLPPGIHLVKPKLELPSNPPAAAQRVQPQKAAPQARTLPDGAEPKDAPDSPDIPGDLPEEPDLEPAE